jgi:hypothetical protein
MWRVTCVSNEEKRGGGGGGGGGGRVSVVLQEPELPYQVLCIARSIQVCMIGLFPVEALEA